MDQARTIAVTGATGFLGRHVVRELLGRGYWVRGLARDRDKAREVLPRDERLKVVQGDVSDAPSLAGLVAGAGACVNCIGILRESAGQTFKKLHVDAVRDLVRACESAGVQRLVHFSALGVTDDARTAYQRTKYDGELLVRRSAMAWTILRPSLVHGPGSDFLSIAKGWVMGTRQPWFFLPYFVRGTPASDVPLAPINREAATVMPVAVEDVAWAAGETLSRPETIGEVINLVGPERLTWPEMLVELRDSIPGARTDLQPFGVPAEAAAIQARGAKAMGIGSLLPFDEGMAVMGAQDSVASPEKARLMLDFSPRPFRSMLREYAARI